MPPADSINNDLYQATLQFAARAHGGQKVPDQPYSYVVHIVSVAQEIMALTLHQSFDVETALQAALLHDVLEDTAVTYNELEAFAGHEVAEAVLALTKDAGLPKAERLGDSLRRIKAQGTVPRMVKMADRIVNLQKPPASWSKEGIHQYLEEAKVIYQELHGDCPALDQRFREKMEDYERELTLKEKELESEADEDRKDQQSEDSLEVIESPFEEVRLCSEEMIRRVFPNIKKISY